LQIELNDIKISYEEVRYKMELKSRYAELLEDIFRDISISTMDEQAITKNFRSLIRSHGITDTKIAKSIEYCLIDLFRSRNMKAPTQKC